MSVLVVKELPDCPAQLATNGKIQSNANLLRFALSDNCKTVQILRQKIEVAENFVDQTVKVGSRKNKIKK